MSVEDDDQRDILLQTVNNCVATLSFPAMTPMKHAMYAAGWVSRWLVRGYSLSPGSQADFKRQAPASLIKPWAGVLIFVGIEIMQASIMVVKDEKKKTIKFKRLIKKKSLIKILSHFVRYQLLCEMVDSIVGQANMIRAVYGLPEKELVEDTSQDEGNFPGLSMRVFRARKWRSDSRFWFDTLIVQRLIQIRFVWTLSTYIQKCRIAKGTEKKSANEIPNIKGSDHICQDW